MFKVTVSGTTVLPLLALEDIDRNTLYLASDQKSVVMQDDRGNGHVVFDLNTHEITIYFSDSCEITENHPGLAVVFPSETVSISLSLEIRGGTK